MIDHIFEESSLDSNFLSGGMNLRLTAQNISGKEFSVTSIKILFLVSIPM